MDANELKAYGIDHANGLRNCMNNEAFYKKILSMFMDDRCFFQAQNACAVNNQRELFSRMHELKGVSGNAALTELHDACAPLVELLRHGDVEEQRVRELFPAVEAAYQRASEGIRAFLGES